MYLKNENCLDLLEEGEAAAGGKDKPMRLRAALFGILVASALFAVECFSVPSSPSWKRTGFKAGWRGSGMDSGKGLRNRVAAPAMGGNEISGGERPLSRQHYHPADLLARLYVNWRGT